MSAVMRYPEIEPLPLVFGSVPSAVAFAEKILDPDQHSEVKSQMGQIMRMAVHNNRRGGISFEDLKDEAHTISVLLQGVQHPLNQLYRYVHGFDARSFDAAQHVAHMAWDGPGDGPVAKRKTFSRCRELALLVLDSYRQEVRTGKHYPKAKIAEELDMTRQHFAEQWFEELSRCHAETQRLLLKVEAELEPVFLRVGVIG